MAFLYESHLGGFFSTDEKLDNDECFCETCGDYDWEIGEYEDLREAWYLLKDKTDIFGTGGYALDYVAAWFSDKPREDLEDCTDLELLALIQTALYR